MKQIALSLFVIAASGAYVWNQADKNPADDMLDSALPADAGEARAAQPREPVRSAARPAFQNQPVPLEPPFSAPFPTTRETTAGIAAPTERPTLPVKQAAVSMVQSSSPTLSEQPVAAVSDALSTASFAVTPAVYIPIPQPRPAYPDLSARVIRAGMKPASHGHADGVYTGPSADAYYGIIQIQALVQGGQLTALKVLKYPSDRRTSVSINRQALPMLRDEAISAQSANVDIISGATLTSRAFIQSLGGALKKASL